MSDSRVIAELTLVHPELVLTPTIEAVPEMTIELEYQAIASPESYFLFFEVCGNHLDRFDRAIESDRTVSEPTALIDDDECRIYRVRVSSLDRLVLPRAAELGIRVLRTEAGSGGWIPTLEIPELEALQEFRAYCERREISFSVDRLYHAEKGERAGEFGLTPIQRETLLVAYEEGYFDDPRGTSMADLAETLGVSSSAVSGRLRRGMETLIENTIQ
ncbi:bacterio-opsin activator [Natrarchaeobius halalkaliphilus]|uniref:Bacterio-opsin activator n=1 Tax=Natrarchaeobius halalkaliphilus TaxID=1679091 RepID=A0A3N6P0X6_9EURY|nr:helix-turn-helix domain-containing protein [Natrarchaeobius halalkaliphilus]RQG91129.1 bacterio-opsin activator [Natrarchaeobius halalkaliphilus]